MLNKLLVPLLLTLLTANAFAASGNIKSHRNNECSIYLCLPQHFKPSDCNNAKKAYLDRIHDLTAGGHRRYTDLPYFHLCVDDLTPDQKQQIDEISKKTNVEPDKLIPGLDPYGAPPNTEYKIIDYRIVTPAHPECTKWQKKYTYNNNNISSYIEICVADHLVPEKEFWVKVPNYYKYEVSKINDTKDNIKIEKSLIYQRSGIFVENELVGELHQEQIKEWK